MRGREIDMQFDNIQVYRCRQCGQLLKTDEGKLRHESHCKMHMQNDKNQLSLLDFEGGVLSAEQTSRSEQSSFRDA